MNYAHHCIIISFGYMLYLETFYSQILLSWLFFFATANPFKLRFSISFARILSLFFFYSTFLSVRFFVSSLRIIFVCFHMKTFLNTESVLCEIQVAKPACVCWQSAAAVRQSVADYSNNQNSVIRFRRRRRRFFTANVVVIPVSVPSSLCLAATVHLLRLSCFAAMFASPIILYFQAYCCCLYLLLFFWCFCKVFVCFMLLHCKKICANIRQY